MASSGKLEILALLILLRVMTGTLRHCKRIDNDDQKFVSSQSGYPKPRRQDGCLTSTELGLNPGFPHFKIKAYQTIRRKTTLQTDKAQCRMAKSFGQLPGK